MAESEKKSFVRLAIAGVGLGLLVVIGMQWQGASDLQQRAQAIGWDVEVSLLGQSEMTTSIAVQEVLQQKALDLQSRAKVLGWSLEVGTVPYDEAVLSNLQSQVETSEQLQGKIQQVEGEYGIQLGFPYSQKMLEVLQWLSTTGLELKGLDLSNIALANIQTDVNAPEMDIDPLKWLQIQSTMPLVKIPAGNLSMGCAKQVGSPCGDIENPSSVEIARGFYVMQSEVTQELYEVVIGHNPSEFKGARKPVEQVTWLDAIRFANQLSVLEGRDQCYGLDGKNVTVTSPDCLGYRLLTEVEWEYAAQGGDSDPYAGSANVDEVAWFAGNAQSTTHEVCSKKVNGYGLCDMSGNVWEWTWDIWTDLSIGSPSLENTVTLPRVVRGGSIFMVEQNAAVDFRSFQGPTDQLSDLGFRVARTVP